MPVHHTQKWECILCVHLVGQQWTLLGSLKSMDKHSAEIETKTKKTHTKTQEESHVQNLVTQQKKQRYAS